MYDILIHLVKFALTASKLTNDWKGEWKEEEEYTTEIFKSWLNAI